MYFAVACGAKSQTRLWLSGCRSLSAIESGVAHFSCALVVLCVARVKRGLHLDRNMFCCFARGTDVPVGACCKSYVLMLSVVEEIVARRNMKAQSLLRPVMPNLRHASVLLNACIMREKCCVVRTSCPARGACHIMCVVSNKS